MTALVAIVAAIAAHSVFAPGRATDAYANAAGQTGSRAASQVSPDVCRHGLREIASSPYAVMVFCDDGIGTSIGVVYFAPGESPEESWGASNRFWQEEMWSRDVTSYLAVPESNLLVVATSNVYGSGGVYLLELDRRGVAPLVEPSGEWSAVVLGLAESRLIRVRLESESELIEKDVRIP